MYDSNLNRYNEYFWIILIFFIALIHGLIYVFLIPPWQHYDEPNHFEIVWAMMNGEREPRLVDGYADFSQLVIESMIANGFYGGMGDPNLSKPPDDRTKVPGDYNSDEPPLYYLLVSVPIRLFGITELEAQLFLVRITSFILYLTTILISWGVVREITSAGNPLRIVLPMSIALLPSFTDIMTAVNNDVGAVFILSLTLWGGLRLIVRGFSLIDILWVTLTAALSFYTKRTAIGALIIVPISLFFAFFRNGRRKYPWAVILFLGFIVLDLSLSWGDANFWHRSTKQSTATRTVNNHAAVGDFVFYIDTGAGVTPSWTDHLLFQLLPKASINELAGKSITFGAWVWADQDIEINTPILHTNFGNYSQIINATQEPQFIAFHVDIPQKNNRIWITLTPTESNIQKSAQIYYDGIILVRGRRPIDEPPIFTQDNGSVGFWGGKPFVNSIRNSSAEQSGFRFHPEADRLGSRFTKWKTNPSLIITSLMDYSGSEAYLKFNSKHLFQTFWARFGWGFVSLRFGKSYLVLAVISLLGFIGAILGIARRWPNLRWEVLFLMGIVFIISWGGAFTGLNLSFAWGHVPYPVARYTYPAIIPTMLILSFGWLEIIHLIAIMPNYFLKKFKSPDRLNRMPVILSNPHVQITIIFVLFLILDLVSFFSIAKHYGFI